MDNQPKSNLAKGVDSFDLILGENIVQFFNRNSTPYPTEVGAPKFDLVPVEKQKDIMVNVARLHAQKEYERIMDLVKILQKQAQDLKRRLDITDMIHQAVYNFQVYHGNTYWLLLDTKQKITRLSMLGPNDWSSGVPSYYTYICKVKWLGDYSWEEVIE